MGALRSGYLRKVYPRVRRSYFYPKMAKRLGLEGRVLVTLEIDARGSVIRVSLHKACAHAPLNEAAREALRRIKSLPAPPPEILGPKRTLLVTVPLKYALRGAR